MSWAERLQAKLSGNAGRMVVAKVAKPAKPASATLATPNTPAFPINIADGEGRRHAYRFRLHNGDGGGIYLTAARTIDVARDELLVTYGNRLAMVAPA